MIHPKVTSLRQSLNLAYLLLSVITVITIEFLLLFIWHASNNQVLETLQNDMEITIVDSIDSMLVTPAHILAFGQNLFEKGVLSIDDTSTLDPYFASAIANNPDYIYSYSIGTEDGEYYGARRNTDGDIELMQVDASTQFRSIYYDITSDYQKSDVSQVNSEFDPRTRNWYELAKSSDSTVFSDVYKHFFMDDLAISLAAPIHDQDGTIIGVLGAHMILSNLNDYLEENVQRHYGTAYLIDASTGNLIANSTGVSNFQIKNGSFNQIPLSYIASDDVIETYSEFQHTGITSYIKNHLFRTSHIHYVSISKSGINWLLIIELPNHPLTQILNIVIVLTLVVTIIATLFSIFLWNLHIRRILEPITELTQVTMQYTSGNYNARASMRPNNEIGKLVDVFNSMASSLTHQMEILEEKVRFRTQELERTNNDLQQTQDKIVYLSYHDQLTGLYNRRFFEESLQKSDNIHNLPISIVMLDMNGLKLINDAFGHASGDLYLKTLANLVQDQIRSSDIAARYGGDEIVVILPLTDSEMAERIIKRLKESIKNSHQGILPLSVSFGYSTKWSMNQSLIEVLHKADEIMYKNKLVHTQLFRSRAVQQILDHMKNNYPSEHEHALTVQSIAKKFGRYLGLGPTQLQLLIESAYLHDIGKVSFPMKLLNKKTPLTPHERELLIRHSEIGYQVLNSANETKAFAEIVLSHHENWDGSGYPKGLSHDAIPYESRIIRIIDSYVAMSRDNFYGPMKTPKEAIEELLSCKGRFYDPELVETFIAYLDKDGIR